MKSISFPVELSLANPRDPYTVTMVADVVGVGTTNPSASGDRLVFTEEFLREHAKDFVNKPINILLDEEGATGHSQNPIGSVVAARWDDVRKKVQITASLWRHYFPETIRRVIDLFSSNNLEASAEVVMTDYEQSADENNTPLLRPKQGSFNGVALVNKGADPNNAILALASAYSSDSEQLQTIGDVAASTTITNGTSVDNTVGQFFYGWPEPNGSGLTNGGNFTGGWWVVPNVTINTPSVTWNTPEAESSERMSEGTNGEADMPTEVVAESAEPTTASEDTQLEVPANLEVEDSTDWKARFEELQARVESEEKQRQAEATLAGRLSELGKIAPLNQAKKDQYAALLADMSDDQYAAMKTILLAAVEPANGIAPDAEVEPPEEIDHGKAVALSNLPKWREEAQRSFGQPNEKKE